MIRITKQEREALENVGLIRYRKQFGSRIIQDSNLVITNREHIGKNSKTYYIVEEPAVLKFLGYYDGLNLQRINAKQHETLVKEGLLDENNTQHWGEYKANAICYENQFGERRIAKVAKLMVALGLWKSNKNKVKSVSGAVDSVEEETETNEFAEMFKLR